MAATVQIEAFHGSLGVASVLPADARFHCADSDPTTDDATVAILIPSTGTGYSWRKSLKLHITQTPVGSISNLRFFSDGVAWGTGITCYAKKQASYVEAAQVDEYILFDPAAVDVATYTLAAPLTVTAGAVLSNPAVGYGTQDYVVLQVAGSALANPGSSGARTISYRWDET